MMKGLILKDLINFKQQAKLYLVMLIVWASMSVINRSPSFFGGVIAILSAITPLTAIAYDEKAKWDGYALTMPVSRADIILGKYILALIFIGFGSIVSLLLNIYLSKSIIDSLSMSLVFTMLSISLLSITLPFIFKFGVEKGRLIMIIIPMVISALIVLISKLDIDFVNKAPENFLFLLPLFALAFIAASIKISIAIFEKKEF